MLVEEVEIAEHRELSATLKSHQLARRVKKTKIMKFIIRLVLTALFFAFLLPLIPGVTVTSGFWAIVLLAFTYRVATLMMKLIWLAVSALATLLTAGLALILVIPAYGISFWLLPTLTLATLGRIMPGYLHFNGWLATSLAALVMFALHFVIDRKSSKARSK